MNQSRLPAHPASKPNVAGAIAGAKKDRALPAADTAARLPSVDPQIRHSMIAEAAYFRSHRHAGDGGHDIEHWLAAEREIDANLPQAPGPR